MAKQRHRVIYGNMVNLRGLYSQTPLTLHYEEEGEQWYDATGNFSASGIGIGTSPGCITFASTSKDEVSAWTDGVLATMALLRRWGSP